jgi:hypothetical protein
MPGYDHWRLAPADSFVREGKIVRVAHDPGDPQITSHCPFCGSGQIVGRSDGTIGCDFCGMNYIVRVQPAFPGMPQAPGMGGAPTDVGPDGMPVDPAMEGEVGPDGMPIDPAMEGEVPPDGGFPPEEGEEEGGFPPGEDEGAGEDEGGFPPDDGDEDDAPPPPPEKKPKGKPKGKGKKEGRYRTVAGDLLDEDSYIRHLAVLHSGGSPAVLAALREEAGR